VVKMVVTAVLIGVEKAAIATATIAAIKAYSIPLAPSSSFIKAIIFVVNIFHLLFWIDWIPTSNSGLYKRALPGFGTTPYTAHFHPILNALAYYLDIFDAGGQSKISTIYVGTFLPETGFMTTWPLRVGYLSMAYGSASNRLAQAFLSGLTKLHISSVQINAL
jgi:hypothetical protein